MPIVADAAAAIRADMSGFNRDLKLGGEKATRTLGEQIKGVFNPRNLAVIGVAGGVALAGAITAGLSEAVRALIDIERLNAQTDAVIRSTGGAANVTREQIEEAAEAAEAATTIQRESVQEAQNLLLTFTNVRDEAGEGNDIFSQATESILDMSVAMGTDARTSAMQLGKALNDPIQGMKQLGRAGVQFSDEQEEMIRKLVETGDLLGAQKVILAELETQFGGSAEAFADTTAGRIQRFQNDVGNMFESIILGATYVADAFETLATNIDENLDKNVFDLIGERWEQDFGDGMDDLAITAETKTENLAQGVRRGITSTLAGASEETREAAKLGLSDPVLEQMLIAEENANKSGYQVVIEYAKGLLTPQSDVRLAIEAALQVVEDEMSATEEIAYLSGQRIMLQEARGIASAEGKTASVTAIDAALALIEERMAALSGSAYNYGENLMTDYAAGIVNNLGVVADAGRQLGGTLRRQVAIESEPEASDSPLRGITKWGGNVVKTIADGIYANLGLGSSAAGALAGALVPGLTTPALGMAGVAAGTPGARIFQLYVNGVERTVSTPEEAIQTLVDLGVFGEGRLN